MLLVETRFNSLDPRFTDTNHDHKVSRIVVPGLTVIDDDSMEPRLLLAESIVDVDERTVDVTLREGVRFSDGTPVTADDVVYTYTTTLDPAVKSLMLRNFRERMGLQPPGQSRGWRSTSTSRASQEPGSGWWS